ncbi:MAG: hypothetical protein LBV27_04025 [Oscillospiraceae bacterium]|jgi:hypothetical protein|nr:hypothetical protein [Oscillospiraceae bacterium]
MVGGSLKDDIRGYLLEAGNKSGPKTNNPKPYRMAVKYDEECKQILDVYCELENVNKMEAAGIKKLRMISRNEGSGASSRKVCVTSPADTCPKADAA